MRNFTHTILAAVLLLTVPHSICAQSTSQKARMQQIRALYAKAVGKKIKSADELAESGETVKTYADSVSAFVYQQRPAPSEKMRMGTEVTLSLTTDPDKVPDATKK